MVTVSAAKVCGMALVEAPLVQAEAMVERQWTGIRYGFKGKISKDKAQWKDMGKMWVKTFQLNIGPQRQREIIPGRLTIITK